MEQDRIEYIKPVSQDDLAEIVTACKKSPGNCKRDAGSEALYAAEQNYVRKWRVKRGDDEQEASREDNLVGLALSGGGIRSATFSLGIMQALVNRDLLKRFDYLSTVSGGGYIGSSITWLTSKLAQREEAVGDPKIFSTLKGQFPYGSDDPRPEKIQRAEPRQERMLKYLREHGYYLTPGTGINAFSLLGAILRGTCVNLLVWLPTFVLIFLFLLWAPGLGGGFAKHAQPPIYTYLLKELAPTISHPALSDEETKIAEERAGFDDKWQLSPPEVQVVREELMARAPFETAGSASKMPRLLLFEAMLWLGLSTFALLALSATVYSVLTWFSQGKEANTRNKWYARRSTAEKFVAILFPLGIVSLLIGSSPLVGTFLHSWLVGAAPLAAFIGAAIALRDFMASGKQERSQTPGALVGIGAGLFLYGVMVSSYLLAQVLLDTCNPLLPVIVVATVVFILGWFVNLNYVSIHRYYRDRLMETFMPDIEDAQGQRTGRALGANTACLHEISNQEKPHGPYHIVNTNVVLVSSADPVYRSRGGDNFILSPLYCGSNATGWRRTENYMDGRLTLATAVAISGAAANPNTGVGGVGLTRNLFVSLVMSLLNLRLGYWADHPNPKHWLSHLPNHFRPGAYALSNAMGAEGGGYQENRDFVQLSDGGHFENMGLYELIRRRVKLAIVCDGGADREFSFSDMQTTVRRIEDDFGARIKILEPDTPDRVVPDAPLPPRYPPRAGLAKQGHMLASITYADGSKGWLIFMKTTLIEDVSFKVKGYVAQNPTFPDESTADQFFDEVQFEAYRELGYCIADKMLDAQVNTDRGDISLQELISDCGSCVPVTQ